MFLSHCTNNKEIFKIHTTTIITLQNPQNQHSTIFQPLTIFIPSIDRPSTQVFALFGNLARKVNELGEVARFLFCELICGPNGEARLQMLSSSILSREALRR